MARKKKELPTIEHVEITDVAAEGKALVRVGELVVFVPYVVPGDIVDLKLIKKKHHYAEAEAIKFHKYSEKRSQPFCPHFGVCGGCKWQCLPYEEQIKWKQKQVVDNLTRIGKIQLPECNPILGSEKTQEYRNKLEFGFSNKRWLTREQIASGIAFDEPGVVGFHTSGAFDKILPIEECHLMAPINDKLRNGIRDYAYEHHLSFYDQREHTGLLRGMMIRLSNTGELMLLIQFCISNPKEESDAMAMLDYIKTTFEEVTSLMWVNNQKFNDTFGDLPVMCYSGTNHIFLKMGNLKFKVGPKSFYQTNTEQAKVLYDVAKQFAFEGFTEDSQTKPLVYDLYTGTGTIANYVADMAQQVIGIEYVPDAIEDAKENSKENGINNTLFYAGDMKDILNEDFIKEHGRPDIIITDPPRAGMHQDVINTILFASPKRIVYVSCNPATQARDLQLLDTNYQVSKIQPVDMFPHTQHVENVVMLDRRD